ncbi:MAG: hypothetical protein BroJett011_07610 [Chloroflexota bacterium]|nr:MAG: hypothetical protein BroJett011_07610 [Chloroflexota bacterium]
MRTIVVDNTDLHGGSRLDFDYNYQVRRNQELASSQYNWKQLDEFTLDICDGPRETDPVAAGIPYLRLGDLNAGDIAPAKGVFVAEQKIKPRFRLSPDDVLLSKTSDEPRAALVTERLAGATFSPDIFRLRIDPHKISPVWISLFFNTRYSAQVVSQRAYGARIKRLRVADLRHIRVPVPPRALAEEVEALERQAQGYSEAAHSSFQMVINGLYGEIDVRVGERSRSPQKWLLARNNWLDYRWDVAYVRSQGLTEELRQTGFFRPVGEMAHLAVASRRHLEPEQAVCYVNVSDIDAQYFTFRQTHQMQLKELSDRLRLPLQADQVLVLASGSNLGSEDHPVAVVEPELDGCLTSNAFIALEFVETPLYFGLVMRHPLVLAQLRALASGSVVQQTINKEEFKNLLLPVLGSVWRQDYNDRARIAWEKRRLAIDLRQQAIDNVEVFITKALSG